MVAHIPLNLLKKVVLDCAKDYDAGYTKFLLDLIDLAEKQENINAEQLVRLKLIASDKTQFISYGGWTLLGSFAEFQPEAQALILEMANASVAHVRFNAILSLNERCPESLVMQVISSSLKDKSKKVRCKAADWTRNFKIDALLPMMEQALSVESDREVQQVLSAEIRRKLKHDNEMKSA